MKAANSVSPEGIEILLKAGADPNIENPAGMTALAYGILSENIDVINLLAPATTAGVDQIIIKLAQSSLDIKGELEIYLKKIDIEEKRNLLLEKASFYGNDKLLDFLLNKSNFVWSEVVVRKAFENVIKSDKVKAVQLLEEYCIQQIPAVSFIKEKKERNERSRLEKSNSDSSHMFDILKRVPKSKEFDHSKLMEKISTLILETNPSASGRLIKYRTLIEHLQAQVVHHSGDYFEHDECPEDCSQKTVCGRIRDVLFLLNKIMKKMSEEFPIFRDVISAVVGSLKEQTKIGKIDETDVALIFSAEKIREFKNHLEFDPKLQKFKVKKIDDTGMRIELPDELKPFVTAHGGQIEELKYHGFFDMTKYFITFIEQFYNIINSGTLNLPTGMILSTKFVPCKSCKNENDLNVRCRHKPGCKEHALKKNDPGYHESCRCRIFTSPCLTWTKVGVVLHLEFINDDGSIENLDIDVCPPAFHLNSFDGSNTDKRSYLETMRMPGWLTEWFKTEDLSEATSNEEAEDDLKIRISRLRFINIEEVIADPCILFLDRHSLAGNKKSVYIIMKVLKKCADANLTSYQMKFAVHNALSSKKFEKEDIKSSLDHVLKYRTIRNKFNGRVDEALKTVGVKEIILQDEGVLFVMDKNVDLVAAAKNEDMKVVTSLIRAGANINFSSGQTPVQLILASNKTDHPVYKKVALYKAARDGDHELCEELLDQNANTDLKDEEGLTPLYFVCSDGNSSLVEKMIRKGADVNSEGCLQIALDLYHIDVAKILIHHITDPNKVFIITTIKVLIMFNVYLALQKQNLLDECCQDRIP